MLKLVKSLSLLGDFDKSLWVRGGEGFSGHSFFIQFALMGKELWPY